MPGIEKKNVVIARSYSSPTLATRIGNASSENRSAARPARRTVKDAGSINRTTAITSADRHMSSGFDSGEKRTRDTGVVN